MKPIICKLLWGILCFCIFVLFACSSKQKNTMKPEDQVPADSTLESIPYDFIGDQDGPQPVP